MSDSHPTPENKDSTGIDTLGVSGVTTRVVPGVVDIVVLAPSDRRSGAMQAPGDPFVEYWQTLTLRRGPNTRCTGAWEIVHGRIEAGEKPEDAALRELMEETGLAASRLYSVTVNAFYLHQTGTVQLALVFAAVIESASAVTLGSEHDEYAWRSMSDAGNILAWPREREALNHVNLLLRTGDAGPVDDVLRVR